MRPPIRTVVRILIASLLLLGAGRHVFAQVDSAARSLLLDAVQLGDTVIAVGERGAVVFSNDNGKNWSRIQCPASATLTGVSFAPLSSKGWVVGHQGVIMESGNGGRLWTLQAHGEGQDAIFLDVIALSDERAIAIGAFGLAVSTNDAGKSWQRIKPTDDDRHLNRISAGHDGTLYIAGERGLLLRSPDQGKSWEPISTPYEGSFFGIRQLADGSLLAHGLRGHVFRSKSARDIVWEKGNSGVSGLLATAVQVKDGRIFMAGQARCTIVSTDGGLSFSPLETKVTSAVAELLQLDTAVLLSFGENGAAPIAIP